MCLQVTQPGFLATVQDKGRFGYQRFGVPVAGAMDTFAMRAANRLVGNADDSAVLEMGIQAPELVALQDCLIAVTGSGFALFIRGEPAPLWTALVVRVGWKIEFRRQPCGCWAYLALAGGIAVEPVLGSRSTYLRGGFGGFEGRTLQPGDTLYSLHPSSLPLALAGRRLPAHKRPAYSATPLIEVILGPQQEYFDAEGITTFLSSEYLVSPASDRMGYRLQGAAIAHNRGADIVTDGLVAGAVQVPSSGQPIIMMRECPTSGGYAKIAVVVSADLPLLAQCVPGGDARIRFVPTTVEAAQARYRQMLQCLTEVENAEDEDAGVYAF